MRALRKIAALVIGMPIACTMTYIGLAACLVLLAVPQLPAWAQQPVADWVLGHPQETYGEPGIGPAFNGVLPLDGYSGQTSFQCLLPPVRGYVTDRFGAARMSGRTHRGIDYGTYYRAVDVRTPFGGKVVHAGWLGPYGEAVVIENAGWQIILAHHSELSLTAGQIIAAGQVIGLSGSTGNSTGIHVHMEFRQWNGESWRIANPEEVLLPGQGAFCDWHALAAP